MSHPNGDQVEPAYPAAAAQPVSAPDPAYQTTSSSSDSAYQPGAVTTPYAAPAATTPYAGPAVPAAPIAPTAAPTVAPPVAPAATAPLAAPAVPADPAATTPYAGPAAPAPLAGPAAPAAPVAPTAPTAALADPTAVVMPSSAVPAGQYAPGYAQAYTPAMTSAYPVTGVPVSAYPTVLEPRKKRTGMIVLTVATIVLGLTTAGMGTMYLLENGKRTQADTKVSEQAAALEKADQKIKEIESKLSTAKEENAKLNQDLTGAKNKTDEVTKARDALAACFQAIDAYARSRNATTAKDADTKCGEASKYY